MVSQKVKVVNKSGLHARPAGELVKVASSCTSDVVIRAGEKDINPKSILTVIAAAIRCGTELIVECTGENEEEDLKRIVDAINCGFGEQI
ncbi:HPr family phosphocarrier protein [Tissierella sp. Yu-01]|uniref:HPr family phosphocarrier protein n=1 Tax=Tissierella sp. Yu-01 TaxID=3035694 RepID=UPI00240CFEF6|nr:HPr family phosphocarrier protein [Tissierella sp. Yu-01]WFA09259.1 HPr family phosphocarrier protein [Tissierella sp. Yu-01]